MNILENICRQECLKSCLPTIQKLKTIIRYCQMAQPQRQLRKQCVLAVVVRRGVVGALGVFRRMVILKETSSSGVKRGAGRGSLAGEGRGLTYGRGRGSGAGGRSVGRGATWVGSLGLSCCSVASCNIDSWLKNDTCPPRNRATHKNNIQFIILLMNTWTIVDHLVGY